MRASDLITDASFVAVPIAILFFLGWAYLSAYLGHFGVDLTEFEISISTILVYSFNPIYKIKAFIFVIIFIIFISIVYFIHNSINNAINYFLTPILLVLLIYFGVIIAVYLAEESAKNASNDVWEGVRVRSDVIITTRGQNNVLESDYLACSNRRGLVHVFSSPDRTLLLCRDKYSPTEFGMLYMIAQPDRLISRRKIRAGL